MGDYVSFETAFRLAEMGFPQPEMEFGQIWYDYRGNPIVITNVDGDGANAAANDNYIYTKSEVDKLIPVYAPTATDILRELPRDFQLDRQFRGEKMDWVCNQWYDDKSTLAHIESIYYNVVGYDNPAEACAAAWLAINEKKA